MSKFKCCPIQPPTIDFNFLHYLIDSARKLRARQTEDRKEVCAARGGTDEDLRDWNEQEKANLIILQISIRAGYEARQGNDSAVVMDVPAKDVSFKYYDPGWLEGAAKLVFEFCEKAGLKPTLEHWEYWPDRDGPSRNGFEMVIHFERETKNGRV